MHFDTDIRVAVAYCGDIRSSLFPQPATELAFIHGSLLAIEEIQLVSGGGNLWPLVVFVDFVHLMGTAIIFACGVLLTRRLRMSA